MKARERKREKETDTESTESTEVSKRLGQLERAVLTGNHFPTVPTIRTVPGCAISTSWFLR